MSNRIMVDFRRRMVTWSLWIAERKRSSSTFSVRNCWNDIKQCIVIWPEDGLSVSAAGLVLGRLKERFSDSKLTVLALPGVGASVPNDIEAKIIQLDQKAFNFFGLPVRALKNDLASFRADVIVDLSGEFNPLSSYICAKINARMVVGFADPRRDPTFNYQVAPGPGSKGIERYRVLARYIG